MIFFLFFLRSLGVRISGNPRYIHPNVYFDDFKLITLSQRVVISKNVVFLTHDYSLTTGLVAINKTPVSDFAFVKPIILKENVFIGINSILLPGTIINDNVVIGAGSVVRGVIPSNSIVIGNPAKVVGILSDKAYKWFDNLENSSLRID